VRKALLIGLVAAALICAPGASAHEQSLSRAVRATESAPSFRYSIAIGVQRAHAPAELLRVRGVSGRGQLFVHVEQAGGREAAAMIDGPFLYEQAPNGVIVNGTIRWLRVPVAAIGPAANALNAVRTMTPSPLLRVLGESRAGRVDYNDPIVRGAITRLSGGVEFRSLHVSAQTAADGLIHGIRVTGVTADGTTKLDIEARLYAFGRPVHLTPPAEGTFVDAQLLQLAE
jgi:hypothetical protein